MSRAIRGSNYDLNMSLNYVRLAFQSASPNREAARNDVERIIGDSIDRVQKIRLLALALAALMAATPADAKCHHYSIWKNPWPQSCRVTVAGAVDPAPQQAAPAPDRSWYVEVTDMPKLDPPPPPPPEYKPTMLDIRIKNLPEAVQREIGIEALRQIMNNLRLDP